MLIFSFQPIKEIMTRIKEREKEVGAKILLHTDAAQTIGKVEVDVEKLNVDFLTIVGHKVRRRLTISSII